MCCLVLVQLSCLFLVGTLSCDFVSLHIIHVSNVFDYFGSMSTVNDKITLASWNVRGLGNNIKCGKVYSYLNSLKADILFLQETHTIKDTEYKLKPGWISQVYHAPFTTRARGVAILFRNTIPFLLKSKSIDPNGRFILISGHINSFPITLLNIYGPNSDDPTFFRNVFDLLPEDISSNIYIGGDFNCYLDSSLDRSSTKAPPTITSVQTLNNLIKSRNMADIWRIQHPDKEEYSFYSHVHQSFTRIDYFIVEASSIPNISNTNYHSILISDHSPVTLQLKVSFSKPKYKWRFNPLLLSSPGFKEYINKISENSWR